MSIPAIRTTERDDSEVAIAQRVATGDARAFESVLRRHNRMLYRIARSILRDDAVYQRLYFIKRDFYGQRVAAETELVRRSGPRTGLRMMERNSDRVDRALDAALEMTFPASDPIAVPAGDASTTVRDDPDYLRELAAST